MQKTSFLRLTLTSLATISHSALRCGVLFACFISASADAWTPGDNDPDAATALAVDRFDRQDVLGFYNCSYLASEDYAATLNWTGSISGCNAGTTGAAFSDDVLRRVNYYRAMVGMPGDITFDSTYSAKSQEAALMMSAQGAVSHYPGTSWACYTADGAEAAVNSNLALGSYGPDAIDRYMLEEASNNTAVGHRRWILYSLAQVMGTGDVPASSGQPAANLLWVVGSFSAAPAPQFVAWPNDGYVPASLVPARWSLSYPGADFNTATVTMTQNGSNIPLTVIYRAAGAGDNTIVWEPAGIPSEVTDDTTYEVTVNNISGSGPSSKTYTVTLMNPNILGDSIDISGAATPPSSGQAYTFNSISGSTAYELEVATSNSSVWTEGAEGGPTPNITDETSAAYALIQGGLTRTGSKAFQLTYPSGEGSDQSYVVTRNVIPGAASKLEFYQRARFSSTTTTLAAQVSSDSGNTWTTVWSRNGAGTSSNNWDSRWIKQSIDVSAYQGEIIHLRYLMERNGSPVVQGTSSELGFFIDDITVTDSSYLDDAETTTLSGSATDFTLDSQTAGKTLTSGDTFMMRVRPYVGCRWFGFGAMKAVTVTLSETTGVSTPLITPPSSEHTGSVSVDISCATNGAAIHYTVDGSIPTNGSPLYNESFSLTSSATVKAKAVKSGHTSSGVASVTIQIRARYDDVEHPDGPATPPVSNSSTVITSGTSKYSGFLTSTDGSEISGYFKSIKVSKAGTLSANMYFGNVSYSLKGLFDENGQYSGVITPKTGSPATVDLQLVMTSGGGYKIEGTVVVGGQTANVTAVKSGATASQAGTYTVLLLGGEDEASAPQGHGYALMTVTSVGAAKMKGLLADGTKWTAKCYVTPDGEMPLYYGKVGTLAGLVRFRDVTGVSDCDAEIRWRRSGSSVTLELNLVGSRFRYTGGRLLPGLSNTTLNAEMQTGSGASAEQWGLDWSSNNKINYAGPEKIKMKLNIKSGQLKGKIPTGGMSWTAEGVVFQKQDIGAGLVYTKGQPPRSLVIVPKE